MEKYLPCDCFLLIVKVLLQTKQRYLIPPDLDMPHLIALSWHTGQWNWYFFWWNMFSHQQIVSDCAANTMRSPHFTNTFCQLSPKLLLSKKSLEEEMTALSHTQNDWLAPASWRKNPPSRRRRESEFVWKNGGKSVGRASRVPHFGFQKAVKFCSGAEGRTRTDISSFSDSRRDHLGYLGLM